jgi:hypothetical protein
MQKYLASHRVAGNNINVTGAAIKLSIIHNADAECNVYINHAFNVYEIFYFNHFISRQANCAMRGLVDPDVRSLLISS